jgi:preprotein translocase subunit SecA
MNDLTEDILRAEANKGGVEGLRNYLVKRGKDAYLQKRGEIEALQPGLMTEAERYFVLSQTDNLWKEHLQAIKFVQQAVGLRGYAQKDPLIEYKLEGYNLFVEMMAQIRRNVIYSVYQFEPKRKVEEGPEQQQGGGDDGSIGSRKKKDKEEQVPLITG